MASKKTPTKPGGIASEPKECARKIQKGFTFTPGKSVAEIARQSGTSNCIIARKILEQNIPAFAHIEYVGARKISAWAEVPAMTIEECAFANNENPVKAISIKGRGATTAIRFNQIVRLHTGEEVALPYAQRGIYGWDKVFIANADISRIIPPKPKTPNINIDEAGGIVIFNGDNIKLTPPQIACLKIIIRRDAEFRVNKFTSASMPQREIIKRAGLAQTITRLQDVFKSRKDAFQKLFTNTGDGHFKLNA